MSKTLLEKFEDARRQPVPDETLTAIAFKDQIHAVAEPEPPTTGGNPQGREDFNRLLDAAAAKKEQGSET